MARRRAVFVDESAEEIAATEPVERDDFGLCSCDALRRWLGEWRPLVQ